MGRRILLVEDEKKLVLFLKKLLETEGFSVEVAETGDQAVEVLKREEFDLMLLDLNLPGGIPGERVLDALNEMKLERSPGVFVYTGSDDHITRLRMLRKGAHDFYVKPFFPEPLIRRLEHYLASRDQ